MANERKSKRILWELMLQLEEAGEEDVCSLLNQLMGVQPYFGSGVDLGEYLEALRVLGNQSNLQLRAYRVEDGRTVYGDVLVGTAASLQAAFSFDSAAGIWRWQSLDRLMVELTDN